MREKNIGLSLISLVVFIFLLGPLLIIAASSFEPGTVLKFPPEGFSSGGIKIFLSKEALYEPS